MQLDSYTLFSLFVAYEINVRCLAYSQKNVRCLAARAGKPCALAVPMVVA
jgi:hypothetical protein